ncbi:MAG: hypothetical protein WD770_02045 [Actinomycetota bacterium]
MSRPIAEVRSGAGRARDVLGALTRAAVREERDFTVTGFLKFVIEPLVFMVVYFILVTVVLRRGGRDYLLFLLCALLPFRYFSGVISGSLNVIQGNSTILVNRSFPRSVLPLTVLGSQAPAFLVSLLLLGPLMAYYGVAPTVQIVWLPLVVVVLAVLTAAGAYVGAVLGLYFPDLKTLVQNLLRAAFFLSTGLFRVRTVFAQGPPSGGSGRTGEGSEQLANLIRANPLSGLFDAVRAVIINGRPPKAIDLLYPLAFGLVVLAVGAAVYRSRESQFAKEV